MSYDPNDAHYDPPGLLGVGSVHDLGGPARRKRKQPLGFAPPTNDKQNVTTPKVSKTGNPPSRSRIRKAGW